MRRRLSALELVLFLVAAGCASPLPQPSPVPASLAPGAVVLPTSAADSIGCPANVVEGALVVDDGGRVAIAEPDASIVVRWPYGYAGRRSGSEVEILDRTGVVVARTGTRVRLPGGEVEQGVWYACPGVTLR